MLYLLSMWRSYPGSAHGVNSIPIDEEPKIILMSVGGMLVEDCAWATTVYRNALERDIRVKLNHRPAMAPLFLRQRYRETT